MTHRWLGAGSLVLFCVAWGCGSGEDASTITKQPKDGGTDCGNGKADCDGNPANGCEVDTAGDDQNCGACGMTCGLSHATAVCESGSCQLDECDPDYADCDGDPKNGCEAFLDGDPDHCGACGTVCASDAGTASCTNGKCDSTTCQSPLADCDGDPANGCEVTTNDDPLNCGACDNACDFPHAAADCEQSVCQIGPCDTDYANCDNNAGNGCEIDTQTSLEHCGACNATCGNANATPTCQAGQCQLACDNGFQDCDGNKTNGCEVSLQNDVANCGGCGAACPVPTVGVAVCVNGVCGVAGCPPPLADCDGLGANGCETDTSLDPQHCGSCAMVCPNPLNASVVCVASSCGVGPCNAGFENCNGQSGDGCEIDTNTDLANCGACNAGCSFPNAAASCSSGSCNMGNCSSGFTNCNGSPTDGCEANTATDPNNCGACGNDCDSQFPNSTTSCNGTCQFAGCQPGFYDVDGSSANGCEYACTFQSSADLPDDSFIDSNCDGIDGDVSAGVFVATSGNDGNPGTKQLPMATVTGGIGRASITGKTQVFISNGTYSGRVTLVNGISLYGGYSASNNWQRSASFVATIQSTTVINGYVAAMVGSNITSTTTIDRLTITTTNTSSIGTSNYGFHCAGCGGVRLRNDTIHAGSGGGGTAGNVGTAGSSGSAGNGGISGSCDDNGTGGAGGPGGTSACGRTGGNGGKGGNSPGSNSGATGGTGVTSTAGGPGGGSGDPGGDGQNGQPGANGSAGSNGPGGSGGGVSSNFWQGVSGGNGSNGGHGNGGGGGGGGGSQSCTFCNDGYGNGGGGGGAGGCAGTSGGGGGPGGGSFGVFLVNSTGIQLTNNDISSTNGGAGGAGGNRGAGGIGGNGGNGGTTCTSEVGQGGNGGKGGNGGNGGYGGGGAGGPSYALYRSGTTVSTVSNILSFGSGGPGGFSSGSSGSTGAAGAVF